ncbi:MAG: hypothetical protein WC479_09920 [Candidatus Izemoplasmatales bacterium]
MAVVLTKKGDVVEVVDALTNQPVSAHGQNGQLQQINGVTQDVTTKYSLTKEDAILQKIQLEKRKAQIVTQHEAQIAKIDAQIKICTDAEALFAGV